MGPNVSSGADGVSSQARNRQWCSVARYGNRAKARQHYARRKAN
ncbi:CGNR zinc finger domain-containing protein [Saccharopolyspora hattusasensis]